MPNGEGIKKDTFTEADEKTRIALTFDLLSEIHENQCAQLEKCDGRFKTIENRKIQDKGFAGMTGFIGGFIATLFK